MSKLVVFDLDGTLNQTEKYAIPALEKTLEYFGVENATYEQLIKTIGGRIDDYFHDFIKNPKDGDLEIFIHLLDSNEEIFIKDNKAEYEGVTAMLTNLAKNGYKVAVCSNAYINYIDMVLKALNIRHLIHFVQPLEKEMNKMLTLQKLINDVKPEKTVMVGDRYFDMEAAKFNNIPFIGCLYGFNPAEIESADITVNNIYEIEKAVKTLIG